MSQLPRHLARAFATVGLLAGVVAPLTAAGCSAAADDGADSANQNLDGHLSSAADEAWSAYVAEATTPTLQTGCRPYALAPAPERAFRGTALLLHGFSACPQQYTAIAKQLSDEGYSVLVPLLPGHGHAYTTDAHGKSVDDASALPGDDHYRDYEVFAKRMADIVAKATPGENVVMGLSVGGALAASAAIQSPGTFQRVLLMNAFFDISNGFAAALVPVASAIAPEFPYGWGPSCEAERAQGRAGICQFEVTNLRAVQHLGQETLAGVSAIRTTVQVVGVEADPAASTGAIAKAAASIAGSSTCFFEKGVPHSLFSPQDNPGTDMYWLAAATAETTSFLSEGTPFDTVEASTMKPYARCRAR